MEYGSEYTNYQLQRSLFRRAVRAVYLRRAASLVHGRTLDFGCGVGELLRRLPKGSRGLEYNRATVAHCRSVGLAVDDYDGFTDEWSLSVLPAEERFESMVISHVLEHLALPMEVLRKLLVAAAARDVTRVLVIVPGKAGFALDPTHLTFVDREMLLDDGIPRATGFRCVQWNYFPGNSRVMGDWLAHHELQMVFTRS